jgi:hypothetical protein
MPGRQQGGRGSGEETRSKMENLRGPGRLRGKLEDNGAKMQEMLAIRPYGRRL